MSEFFQRPEGHICAEAYMKPKLPFCQQDFDGKQPEVPRDEQEFVAAAFADTHTRVWQFAQSRADVIIEVEKEGDSTLEHFFLNGPDRRDVLFETQKQGDEVIGRRVVIFWNTNMDFDGQTEYSLYPQVESTVRREDNNRLMAAGTASKEERMLSKVEAEDLEREAGFNFQPIGAQEVTELSDYLQRCG